MSSTGAASRVRVRREPPRFRRVRVQGIEDPTPRMRRIVLGGPDLEGLTIEEPAASVRLLLPREAGAELEMPTWTGNQFEYADGERAPIRTFTPLRHDPVADTLTIDVVAHAAGAASDWAAAASIGDEVALSGPGRGHEIDTSATAYLLAGDETALPAIGQLLEAMPDAMSVRVLVEITHADARSEMPTGSGTEVEWLEGSPDDEPGTALIAAIIGLDEMPSTVWVAGEAAAVQKIRRHLFEERGCPRGSATVRGYWKQS